MQTVNNQAIGRATGKIILMGEHAVVYGEPSLAIPFPKATIQTTVTQSTGPITVDCIYHKGLLTDVPERLSNLLTVVEISIKALKKDFKDFSLKIDSSIPAERGMGSSAAVAVATVRALFNYFEQELTHEQLLELVNVSEVIAHGNPSGLDAAMTSGEQPLYYTKGKPFVPFEMSVDAYLVVADTGIKGQTREAVGSIAALMKEHPEETMNDIHQLGELADKAKTAIEENSPIDLGSYMHQAHLLLDKLGVSNEQLNQLVDAALANGALGAKLTGGGRGGCMIALADSETTAHQISDALRETGTSNTWIYQLGDDSFE
ncbi:mevalonate kinase [Desemzia incerta]|uniref:mevalonate kinase n=1 Tax=Desemzia incerta TaxID=82801 RepID=UPI0024C25030|nr:mevalonate kinase [Desemzia incerta]WHZ32241.1 mevalonate kinase [Desemzia incerta]